MQEYFDEIQKYQAKDAVLNNPLKVLVILLPGIILVLAFLLYGSSQLFSKVDDMNSNLGKTGSTSQPISPEVQAKSDI